MPPLGFVRVQDRTQEQHDANALAHACAVAFALPAPALAKGDRIALFDAWKHPDVVADVGLTFTRFHQETGACVGCGGGNAVFSTIAAQRLVSANPTKAFLPFWLGNYGMSRHYMGSDGQGEGSMGSTFAKSLTTDGVTAWATPGANGQPAYTTSDGIDCGSSAEMAWSSYRDPNMQAFLAAAKVHLLGSAGACQSSQDVKAMILNGYGVSFACDNYIGNASIQGSGADAAVVGYWNGRGGHQQSVHAYWENATLGPLYWVQNNWPGSTYPADPAGGPVCGCWVTEAKVDAAFKLDAEVYGLSHLNYFPAQPVTPESFSWDV